MEIDRRGTKGRRRWDKLYPVMFGAALVLTIIAASLSYAAINAVEERLVAEERQCERVQRLRERVNRKGSIIYRVLRAASRSNSNMADKYRTLVALVTYEPPVNCERAVRDPNDYVLLDPVPYIVLEDEGLFNPETGVLDENGVIARSQKPRKP